MLKLMSFPCGSNRNRPLKERLSAEFESPRQVERIFRRFWREYRLAARCRQEGGLAGEGEGCA